MMEAIRVPYRHDDLADTKSTRIAELRPRQRRPGDTNDREVGVGISADEYGRRHPPIGKRYADRSPSLDDVIVGEREAIRREDHA